LRLAAAISRSALSFISGTPATGYNFMDFSNLERQL
jgi:hypothetical protein